jgi:hypothetical protein
MMRNIRQLGLWFRSLGNPVPARDWSITLGLTSLLLVGAVVFAADLFWGIRSGDIIKVSNGASGTLPSVSRVELTTVLEAYRARAVNFEAHHFPARALPDPR